MWSPSCSIPIGARSSTAVHRQEKRKKKKKGVEKQDMVSESSGRIQTTRCLPSFFFSLLTDAVVLLVAKRLVLAKKLEAKLGGKAVNKDQSPNVRRSHLTSSSSSNNKRRRIIKRRK
jgi:hypothetical protein